MHPIINTATTAARKAADYIQRSAERLDKVKVAEKNPNDFVTQIDQKAEAMIKDIILTAYPDHTIMGEESGLSEGEASDHVWIIDPLDGTTNFIHGYPHYAISIALKVKGRVEYGVIYDPVRQDLFTAVRGRGAQLNQHRLRVANQTKLAGAFLGTGFPYRNKDQLDFYLNTFKDLFSQAAGIRRAGSAALDLAYIAAGRLDGFWEIGLKEWDIAAGVLMIKEAGGLVTDFSGSEEYKHSGNIVAGNPRILKAMLQEIRKSL